VVNLIAMVMFPNDLLRKEWDKIRKERKYPLRTSERLNEDL
jgi:hypothetical protein